MKKFFLIGLAFLFLINIESKAYKPVYPDAGLWNTINVSYRLNKKWSLLFTQELRLRENYSRLNLLYTNLGVSYNLYKGLKTAIIYRHIDKFLLDNTFSFRNRFMWDLSYKYDGLKNWTFSYRHRAQIEWMDYLTSLLGKEPQLFSRNKFEVAYEFGKWSPNISSELRIQITDPRNNEDDDNLSRNRTIYGLDYSLNDAVKLGAYYLYQKEFNTVTPQIIHIVGLECNLNLNKILDKSKSKKKVSAAKDKAAK